MINPTIAAAIAINNTAPAAKSFVRLIASFYSGETKSARASMDELTASAANTAPITIVTAIHSMRESPNTTPAISTQTAAKQWIQALCSFVINSLIPLKANLKLLALFRNVKPSFFIFIASLIEEGKYRYFLPLSHILTNKQDIHLSYSAIRQDYLLVFIWNDNFVD